MFPRTLSVRNCGQDNDYVYVLFYSAKGRLNIDISAKFEQLAREWKWSRIHFGRIDVDKAAMTLCELGLVMLLSSRPQLGGVRRLPGSLWSAECLRSKLHQKGRLTRES